MILFQKIKICKIIKTLFLINTVCNNLNITLIFETYFNAKYEIYTEILTIIIFIANFSNFLFHLLQTSDVNSESMQYKIVKKLFYKFNKIYEMICFGQFFTIKYE